MFEKVDENRNGEISKDEFLKLTLNMWYNCLCTYKQRSPALLPNRLQKTPTSHNNIY